MERLSRVGSIDTMERSCARGVARPTKLSAEPIPTVQAALNRSHRATHMDTTGRCRSWRPPILIGEQGRKGPSIAGDRSPEHRSNDRVEQSADRTPGRRVLNLDREPRAFLDRLEPVAADHRTHWCEAAELAVPKRLDRGDLPEPGAARLSPSESPVLTAARATGSTALLCQVADHGLIGG